MYLRGCISLIGTLCTEILLKLYAVDGKYFFSHIRQTSLAESSDAADRINQVKRKKMCKHYCCLINKYDYEVTKNPYASTNRSVISAWSSASS